MLLKLRALLTVVLLKLRALLAVVSDTRLGEADHQVTLQVVRENQLRADRTLETCNKSC